MRKQVSGWGGGTHWDIDIDKTWVDKTWDIDKTDIDNEEDIVVSAPMSTQAPAANELWISDRCFLKILFSYDGNLVKDFNIIGHGLSYEFGRAEVSVFRTPEDKTLFVLTFSEFL